MTGKEHLKVMVLVSDDIKKQVIEQVHEDFALRDGVTPQYDTSPEKGKAYIMSCAPEQRISVGHTLSQIHIREAQRIVGFIKKPPDMGFWQTREA